MRPIVSIHISRYATVPNISDMVSVGGYYVVYMKKVCWEFKTATTL